MSTTLGDLLLGTGLETERYYSQLEGMRTDAIRIGGEIERTLSTIGRNTIKVGVDDTALTRLNQHYDLKLRHHRQVVSVLGREKIKPEVDLSAFKEIEAGYKAITRAQQSFRTSSRSDGGYSYAGGAGAGRSRREQSEKQSTRSLEQTIERTSKRLGDRIVKAVAKTTSKSIGDVVTAPIRGISSIFGRVGIGAFEGFGRDLSKNLSKGISSGIQDEISYSLGSLDFVGEKLGKSLIDGIVKALGRDADVLDNVLSDLLGQENIDREGAAVRYQSSTRRGRVKRSASEQAGLEYQFVKENMGAIQRRGADVIGQRKDLQKEYSKLQSKIDEYATKLGVERLEARIKEVESQISSATDQATAAIASNDVSLASTLQGRIKGLVAAREGLVGSAEAIRSQASSKFQTAIDDINSRDEDLLMQERKLGRFGGAVNRASLLVIPKERKSQSRVVNNARNPKSAESQNISAFYEQVVNDVAKRSGVSIPEGRTPKLISVDSGQLPKGVNAGYSPMSNGIYASESLIESFASGNVTKDQMDLLVHELRHAVQHGFGERSIGDSAGVELLIPDFDESRRLGRQIEASTSGNRGISKARSRQIESDAYVFSDRNAGDIYNNVRSTQARLRLEDSIGIGGGKLENRLSQAQFKTLSAMSGMAERSGADLREDLSDSMAQIKAKADAFEKELEPLRNIDILPVEEIEALQERLEKKLKQSISEIVDIAGEFSNIAKYGGTERVAVERTTTQKNNAKLYAKSEPAVNPKYVIPDPWEPEPISSPASLKSAGAVSKKSLDVSFDASSTNRAKNIVDSFWGGYKYFKEALSDGNLEVVESMAEDINRIGESAKQTIDGMIAEAKSAETVDTALVSQLGRQKGQISRAVNLTEQSIAKLRRSNPDIAFAFEDSVEAIEAFKAELLESIQAPTPEGVADGEDIAFAFEDARKRLEDYAKAIAARLSGDNFDGEAERQKFSTYSGQAEEAAARGNVNAAKFEKAEAQINRRADNSAANLSGTLASLEAGDETLISRIQRVLSANGADEMLGGILDSLNIKAGGLLGTILKFGGIGIAVGFLSKFAAGATDVAIEFEKIGVKLKFIEESATSAKRSLSGLMSDAAELGTNAREDIFGYTQIQAASKDTSLEGFGATQLFEAGRQASLVYQLDGEEQGRVFKAFEQMISKGNISAEELRQQLSEALPGAFQIAARSMGVTTAELNKMLERGEVLSSEFLPKFAQQLSAETASGVVGASNTTQASINRLSTSMLELQSIAGGALLPIKKSALKGTADAVDFLTDNLRGLLSIGMTLAASAAWPFIQKGLMSASVLLRNLPSLLRGATTGIVAMQSTLSKAANVGGKFALQMIAIEAAIAAARIAWQVFNTTGGEGTQIAEGAVKSYDKLIEKLQGVKAAADGANEGLKAEGYIGQVDAFVKRVNDATGFGEGSRLNRPSAFEEIYVNPQIERQQAKRTEDGETLRSTTAKTLELSQSYLTGENSNVLQSRIDVDRQIQELQQRQQVVRALRPGSTEELAALVEDEQRLLEARGKSVETIESIRSAVDSRITEGEARLKALEDDFNNDAIDLDTYESEVKTTKNSIAEAKKEQESWNNALNQTAASLNSLTRSLQGVMAQLSDANLANDFQTALYQGDVAQARVAGATSGEVASANRAIEQNSLAQQLANNQAAVERTRALLQTSEVSGALRDAGVNDYRQFGPADLTNKIEYLGDSSPRVTFALETVKQLQELEQNANELGSQLSQGAAEVSNELTDMAKSIEEFFRGIQQEAEQLEISTKGTENEANLSKMKGEIQEAMVGFSKSFINDFGGSLISLIEAFNEPLQNALAAQEGILSAQMGYLNSQIQANQLKNQLPGLGGFNFSQAAQSGGGVGGGPGTLVGIVGSSGVGSGSHLDIRYNRAYAERSGNLLADGRTRTEVTPDIYNRILADGVPLGQTPLTSGWGPRNLNIPGASKFHEGVDFGLATGTKLTSAVPIESVTQPRETTGGGGWVTTVTFADGVAVELLHQDPSAVNAGIGTGGQPVAPAASSIPPAATASNVGVNVPSGLTAEGQRMASYMSNPNVMALLDMAAMAEMGPDLLANNNGFTTGFNGRNIPSLRSHPYHGSELTPEGESSASGRYQFMGHVWAEEAERLGLSDFSPGSQTVGAIGRLDYRGVLDQVANGDISGAWGPLGYEWASLEGNPYGQGTPLGRKDQAMAYFEQRRQAYASGTAGGPIAGGMAMGAAGSPANSALAAQYDAFRNEQTNVIGEASTLSSQNLNQTIANIESQLAAQNALSEVNQRMQEQAAQDQLTESGRNIAEQDRLGNRRVIDLQFEAMEQTPGTELAREVEELRRRYEDDTLGLEQFVDSLGSTMDQATQFIDAIGAVRVSNGGILPDESADALIESLQTVTAQAEPAYNNAISQLGQISSLYQDLNQKTLDEAERARIERDLTVSREQTSLGNEVRRADIVRQNGRGAGREAIQSQFEIDLSEMEMDLDARIRELEDLGRRNLRTPEEVATGTAMYEALADSRFSNLEQGRDSSLRNLARSEQGALADRRGQLGQTVLDRYRMYGGTPFRREGDPNYEEEFALEAQQRSYESEVDSFRQEALDNGYSPEVLQETLSLLEQINEVKLDNIRSEFNEFKPALDLLQGSTTSLFEDLLTGTKTIGESFRDFVGSVISGIAKIAAQKASEALFGGLLGGTEGGGLGGLLGKIFGAKDGGEVPNYMAGGDVMPISSGRNNSYREGYGEISKALAREGPNGVLAALTPGEMVLTVAQTRKYKQLGLDKVLNYKDGGIAGVAGPDIGSTMSIPTGGQGMSVNINVPVTIGGSGGSSDNSGSAEKAAKLSSSLRKAVRSTVIAVIEEEQRPRGILS